MPKSCSMKLLIIDENVLNSSGKKILFQSLNLFNEIIQLNNCHAFDEYLGFNLILIESSSLEIVFFEKIKTFRNQYPVVKIIIDNVDFRSNVVNECKKIGLAGCISKYCNLDDYKEAFLLIFDNKTSFHCPKSLPKSDASQVKLTNCLTKRELEILILIKDGKSSIQIAANLNLSSHTIIAHRKNIHLKLNIHNERELILFANKYA